MDALPRTRLGRLACWLDAAFIVWWFLNLGVVQLVQRVDTSEYRGALIAFGWFGLALGIVGGVLAVAALAWLKDRTWLVVLCLLPLGFVGLFLLGEILVPH